MFSEDCSRVALLLTDTLGDLSVTNHGNAFWTPESVINEVESSKDGGIKLANTLLQRLQMLERDNSSAARPDLQSWDDLYKKSPEYLPPWLSTAESIHYSILTRLEILSFLASTIQNRLLSRIKDDKSIIKNAETSRDLSSDESAKSDGSIIPVLPAHLKKEQKEIILDCYEGMKEDYEKRRLGMLQRLDILVSNFEVDSADDKDIAVIKKRIKDLSMSSFSKTWPGDLLDMNNTTILQHFSTPHSKGISRSSVTPSNATPFEPALASNPEGKLDGTASRVSMPEWSDSKERK